MEEGVVAAEVPGVGAEVTGWHFGGEALDGNVGTQACDGGGHQLNVFVHTVAVKVFGMFLEFRFQGSSFNDLQLMEFDAVEGH